MPQNKKVRKIKNRRTHARKFKTPSVLFQVRYIVFPMAVFTIIFIGGVYLKAAQKVHVLGASTGPVLLARDGSDDGSSSGFSDSASGASSNNTASTVSSSGGSGSSGESGSGGSDSGKSDTSRSTTAENSSEPSAPDNTQVDCVGPDGKHFTTTFHACQELNNAYHHDTFKFTPLNSGTNTAQAVTGQTVHDSGDEEGSKSGVLTEKKKKTDMKDPLDEINTVFENDGLEVSSDSANGILMKQQHVEVQTHFPLSVDPTTRVLTVTTPNGTKEVAVLPAQAVQNLLSRRILTSVESESQSTATDSATTVQKAVLTELNGEPVFEVQGVSQKKMLGFIPIAFSKTAFVSASSGDVVKVDETFLNKILEAISI